MINFCLLKFCSYFVLLFFRSQIEDHLTGDSSIDRLLWSQGGLYRKHYVIIFGILTIATVAIALCRAFMFFSLCMKSSIKSVYVIIKNNN